MMSGTLKNFAAVFLPFLSPSSTDRRTPGMYFESMAEMVVSMPIGAISMMNRVNRRSAKRKLADTDSVPDSFMKSRPFRKRTSSAPVTWTQASIRTTTMMPMIIRTGNGPLSM